MNKVDAMYIHIPFCKTICSYCDFCKVLYNSSWVMPYLAKLRSEIQDKYMGETINTLYVGGGTPSSLAIGELEYLFEILKKIKTSANLEFTFECNLNDINEELLTLLKNNRVNRLSIGIESFNEDKLKFMNRSHTFKEAQEKIGLCRKLGFNNINIDLIYGIPNETIKVLTNDLKLFLKLKVEHISTYSLIIEKNTLVGVNKISPILEDVDSTMYDLIVKTLNKNKYSHYEISNFAKKGYESKHNLKYWNNQEYYGFGVGASGYVEGVRYENTKSITEYMKGTTISSRSIVSKQDNMENELILGLRKIEGVSLQTFFDKYEVNMQDVFPIKPLVKNGDLIYKNGYIFINPSKLYIMNEILLKMI
ncbi:MAG: radical SAM family heme chaperone HemW [Bacilli bacterium]|nr:radical SAM family heme chaperone HemW [Bacilli bacterium]